MYVGCPVEGIQLDVFCSLLSKDQQVTRTHRSHAHAQFSSVNANSTALILLNARLFPSVVLAVAPVSSVGARRGGVCRLPRRRCPARRLLFSFVSVNTTTLIPLDARLFPSVVFAVAPVSSVGARRGGVRRLPRRGCAVRRLLFSCVNVKSPTLIPLNARLFPSVVLAVAPVSFAGARRGGVCRLALRNGSGCSYAIKQHTHREKHAHNIHTKQTDPL